MTSKPDRGSDPRFRVSKWGSTARGRIPAPGIRRRQRVSSRMPKKVPRTRTPPSRSWILADARWRAPTGLTAVDKRCRRFLPLMAAYPHRPSMAHGGRPFEATLVPTITQAVAMASHFTTTYPQRSTRGPKALKIAEQRVFVVAGPSGRPLAAGGKDMDRSSLGHRVPFGRLAGSVAILRSSVT